MVIVYRLLVHSAIPPPKTLTSLRSSLWMSQRSLLSCVLSCVRVGQAWRVVVTSWAVVVVKLQIVSFVVLCVSSVNNKRRKQVDTTWNYCNDTAKRSVHAEGGAVSIKHRRYPVNRNHRLVYLTSTLSSTLRHAERLGLNHPGWSKGWRSPQVEGS